MAAGQENGGNSGVPDDEVNRNSFTRIVENN